MKRVFFLDIDLKFLIAIFSILTMIYVRLYYLHLSCTFCKIIYLPILRKLMSITSSKLSIRWEKAPSFNATEIKAIMQRDTNCRFNRNCCISYQVSQDESEERSVYAYKVRRGYTRVGGVPCLPEIVFIPTHKERYEMRGWRRSRKFKVTKKYGRNNEK